MAETNGRAVNAFLSLCILACCCSIMHIAQEDHTQEEEHIKEYYQAGPSVEIADSLKTGQLYTETPSGEMRLMDYMNQIEGRISAEVRNRKNDLASVRSQMARDFAFNAAARARLKKNLMHKMAVNAKAAHDNLATAMRKTHEKFAKMATLRNKRNAANLASDRQTMKMVKANKREAAHNLRMAVLTQQRAQAAFAATSNAHISQMNKQVAANAAQIKENAKKARKDLEHAMGTWNKKLATFKTSSKTGMGKLRNQLAAMTRRTRQYANNKIGSLVASTASQFRRVRATMARNRHAVDMAVRHATSRLSASLNAQKALSDRRYVQTVKNIQAARREADERTKNAAKQFKVGLMQLSSVVKTQTTKFNKRMNDLSGMVRSNKAAQAKVNQHVNAEMKRMIKLGNDRYKAGLKRDKELKRLIAKNKAENTHRLNSMAARFNQQLNKVKRTMARDRAHHERALGAATSKLWQTLQKQQQMLDNSNAKALAATRRMRLDMMDRVRRAKRKFMFKTNALGRKVASIATKSGAKIARLTGVVAENERKSATGRKLLRQMASQQKQDMSNALRSAISKGEASAKRLEAKAKSMDQFTRQMVNMKLSNEVSHLAAQAKKQLASVALESREAIAALKKEMMYAVKSAADSAKADLKLAVRAAAKQFTALQAQSAKLAKKSSAQQKLMAQQVARNRKRVARMLRDAVSTQARSLLALKAETGKRISKTNRDITAAAKRMQRESKAATAQMKNNVGLLLTKIRSEKRRVKAAARKIQSKDASQAKQAMSFLQNALAAARKKANAKFGSIFKSTIGKRAKADQMLGGAIRRINNAIAAQGALVDSRFAKTIKNMAQARKKAAAEVKQAKKLLTISLVTVSSMIQNGETRLAGLTAVASGQVANLKAMQARVARRVDAEISRVIRISNQKVSADKRAKGALRKIMNKYKAAAMNEVAGLTTLTRLKMAKLHTLYTRHKAEAARDLSRASKKLYLKLSAYQKAQAKINAGKSKSNSALQIATRNALHHAKQDFVAKLTMLTNAVVSFNKKYQQAVQRMTKVTQDWRKADASERALLKMQQRAMSADLQRSVVWSINIGEARALAINERINAKSATAKNFLQIELAEKVESIADKLYGATHGLRRKIADNYLSVKAYCGAQSDAIQEYVVKGKGKGLSSVGDFMNTVASVSAVRPQKMVGLGMGGTKLLPLFRGNARKVSSVPAKINGLVTEYTNIITQVRRRWPVGLGKYLISRMMLSMQKKGILEVNKVSGKAGNFVFINARGVGLAGRMTDFSDLGAEMKAYEKSLTALTAAIAKPKKPKEVTVPGTMWDGN